MLMTAYVIKVEFKKHLEGKRYIRSSLRCLSVWVFLLSWYTQFTVKRVVPILQTNRYFPICAGISFMSIRLKYGFKPPIFYLLARFLGLLLHTGRRGLHASHSQHFLNCFSILIWNNMNRVWNGDKRTTRREAQSSERWHSQNTHENMYKYAAT